MDLPKKIIQVLRQFEEVFSEALLVREGEGLSHPFLVS